MRKIIVLTLMALSGIFSAFAQDGIDSVVPRKERNWYIEVGGGVQVLFSNDADKLNFSKRLTPSISLTVGKWLNSKYGIRLQIGAYSLNGYNSFKGLYVADKQDNALIFGNNNPVKEHVTINPDGSYPHYIRYINPHIDFQVSIPHLFSQNGWGKWDLIPAVGIGYFGTFSYKGIPNVNSISTNYALIGKYSVCHRLDINLEVSAAVLPGSFDGRITDKLYENTLSATIGVSYILNYNDPKKMPRHNNMAENVATQIEFVYDTVYINRVEERIVEKQVEIFPDSLRLSSILFAFNKTTPLKNQETQFYNVAKFIIDNPDANLLVEGYGDKKNGTEEINLILSELRANETCRLLKEKYGVPASKITTKGNGISTQPYPNNKLNRVVIISVIK